MTPDELMPRIKRIYSSIDALQELDLAKLPAQVMQSDRVVAIFQDFKGNLSQEEIENAAYTVIHNIANLQDHLRRWAHHNGHNKARVDDAFTASAALKIVKDLSNNDKHGPPRDGGHSGVAPRLADGTFAAPVNVGPPINTSFSEGDTFVSPDESYLIVTSRRPGGFGEGDLYISFRDGDGGWSEPVNLGETINSVQLDFCPMVTPDGKYLFFSRRWGATWDDTTRCEIYWVDARVLERFRLVGQTVFKDHCAIPRKVSGTLPTGRRLVGVPGIQGRNTSPERRARTNNEKLRQLFSRFGS